VNTVQSLDVITTLSRIENKLDIILTKCDFSKNKKSKFVIEGETPNETTHLMKTENPAEGFVAELMKKVEERKIAKHMGESHGFT